MVFDLSGEAAGAAPSVGRISSAEYARLVADARATVAAVVPPGETVLVVSKGDEQLVSLPGHRGWHFPRAEDGRYGGYYPGGDDDALAHLDELRGQGAHFLVLPATAFWWLDQYREFGKALEQRFGRVARTGSCMIFDLRSSDQRAATAVRSADTAGTAGAGAADAPAGPADYSTLGENVRAFIEATVPEGEIVLVASKGDDRLVDLPGREGWHFPRAEDGRYTGYYPGGDEDAIAHLEDLR